MSRFEDVLFELRQRGSARVSLIVPDDVDEVPKDVWELSPVELSLQGSFSKVAAGLGGCSDLRSLTLDSSELMELPSEIGELSRLEVLEVTSEKMVRLPAQIARLRSLRELRLYVSSLTELPVDLRGLNGLWALEVNYTALTTVPSQVWDLVDLRELSLRDNAIQELPTEIAELVELRYLDLTGNDIQSIPGLSGLKKLTTLLLAENPLVSIDESIMELGDLWTLSVDKEARPLLPADYWEKREVARRRLGRRRSK